MAEEVKQEIAEDQTDEQGNNDAVSSEDAAVEAKALEMGWVPKDEFKGDPDKHRPASEFLKRGEEVIGFIKKDRDKAQKQVGKLEATVAELKESAKRIEKMNKVALEQVRKQTEKEFTARKRQAVETGDTDAFDAIEKEQKDADKDLAEQIKQPETDDSGGLTPAQKAVTDAWVSDNTWFKTDAEMAAVAGTHHAKLLEEKPGLTLAENLEATREYVKSRYPEKFSNGAAPKRGSPVEGSSRTGQSGGGDLWSQIPKADRATATQQIKAGAFKLDASGKEFKSMAARQEAWAKVYLGETA